MKKITLLATLFFYCLQFACAQSGKLESSFNGKGWVTANFPKSNLRNDIAWQILIKKDNSYIMVVGDDNSPFALAHFFSNGTLDKTFGEDGYAFVKRMKLAKAALQSDGKIVVAGNFGYYDSSDFAVARYKANGSLDSTFGNNGMQTTNIILRENATTIAIQNDGKIVVGGSTSDNGQNEYYHSNTYFAVARYNTDGSLDNTFNHNGKQITDFQLKEPPGEKDPGTPEFDYAKAVAIQNDGKIVLAGNIINKGVFALACYKTDGTPDSTFNKNGRQITHFSEGDAVVSSVAIAANGKIVVAGYAESSTSDFALVRYNSDGSPDSTFSDDGRQTTDFGSASRANSVAMQPDNKIILAGYTGDNSNTDFALARYNIDGSLDNSFNNNGKKLTDFGSSDVANSVALLTDGKIVVAGEAVRKDSADYNGDLALARYNSDGSADNNFSDDGKETAYIPTGEGNLQSIAVQADKKIVVAGTVRINRNQQKIFISRYNINGGIDSTFDKNGVLIPDFGYNNEYCYAMTIQKDGKIVITGEVMSGSDSSSGFDKHHTLIARYNTDGSADSTFDKDGNEIPHFSQYLIWSALSVATQDNGKILTGGSAEDTLFHGLSVIARFNLKGSLDSTFSGNGIQTIDSSSVNSIAVLKDGKFFSAGSAQINGIANFAITRHNSNGSPDKSFSNDGKQTTYFGSDDNPDNSFITSIAIQKDGKALVAGTSLSSGGFDPIFALARFNNDGSLDNTFDNDGKLTTAFADDAYCSSVQIQEDGKILAAGEIYDREYSTNIAVTRYNSNGSPDSSFGVNGKIITDLGGNEVGADAALNNNTLYVAGNDIIAAYDLSDKNSVPTVSLTAPANNATFLAPAAHIKLSAAASDADGSISKVEFYNGNTLLHTETVIPYGYVWRNVKLGNYTLTAKAYDNSGNVTTSAPVHIAVVMNTPPVVKIIKPINNPTYPDHAYIHFEAAASDTDGKVTRVEFYNDSTLLRIEYQYPYTYVWRNVRAGTYTITAKATDNWGAQTTSAPVTIRVLGTSIVSSRPSSENEKTAEKDALRLQLSPNPATNIVNIQISGLQANKPATLSIISVSGNVLKKVETAGLAQTIQLDVSSLVSGVYTIKIVSGDKVLYKQFVKL